MERGAVRHGLPESPPGAFERVGRGRPPASASPARNNTPGRLFSGLRVRLLVWWQFPRGFRPGSSARVGASWEPQFFDQDSLRSAPTMPATNQSAVSTLIREVLADPDLARRASSGVCPRAGLQDLVDAGAAAVIGAQRYERTPHRTNRRNGTRPKTVATTAGEVELAIPKLRTGSFFPSLLHPRRRVDKAQMRRDLLRLDRGGLHPQGRRPRQGPGQRVRDLQVHGLADLQGHRRGRARVPVPPPGPHLVPLPVRQAPPTWT